MTNSFIYSIQQSGLVGQIILFILLSLSIISWGIMVQKFLLLKQINKMNALFLKRYDLLGFDIVDSQKNNINLTESPLFNLCSRTCQKIKTLVNTNNLPEEQLTKHIIAIIKEELSIATNQLNELLFVLATISSVGPFFGLLGTVWGIMNAFRGMGMVGAASIGTVAPGIAEALITTVVGLIVAIPALVGYNYFSNIVSIMTVKMEHFCTKLFNSINESL